jgi:hypothetical protein
MKPLLKTRGGRGTDMGNVKVAEKSNHLMTSPPEIF